MGRRMGPRISLDAYGSDKIYLQPGSNPRISRMYRFTKPTELSRALVCYLALRKQVTYSGTPRQPLSCTGSHRLQPRSCHRIWVSWFYSVSSSKGQFFFFTLQYVAALLPTWIFTVRNRFVFCHLAKRVLESRGMFLGWRSRLPLRYAVQIDKQSLTFLFFWGEGGYVALFSRCKNPNSNNYDRTTLKKCMYTALKAKKSLISPGTYRW